RPSRTRKEDMRSRSPFARLPSMPRSAPRCARRSADGAPLARSGSRRAARARAPDGGRDDVRREGQRHPAEFVVEEELHLLAGEGLGDVLADDLGDLLLEDRSEVLGEDLLGELAGHALDALRIRTACPLELALDRRLDELLEEAALDENG